jgi:hypothetical protein
MRLDSYDPIGIIIRCDKFSAPDSKPCFAIIADDSAGRRHFGEEMRFAQKSYALYELNR